ncbi:helix-turn-helix domain-containing protein [Mycolicibacterium fortuitum]|uniref:Helix-turn-helix domain-containing protein n=2 Tax=Mycolicibacterium fortuitum TaxID=1766 RepID=A0A0N9XXA3_MYCFO|nr:helix-turn-helix domain-containing protein [Mycolicibacterium fortuitum]MDO3239493.1 helix-turn-helix domain-containing protein [Mycobacteroides abscessus subsp. abscessus]ALI24794.1 Transcriptional regulator, AraC family [Mycolicibacterium fortuitum]MCA4754014.1 helix-turn-helix transcriptional regulator [Mycolicibacterium fortuitum]MDV7192346.1 helix-turn-helix domain-containing protein [Mycolicibacterium fortuitum]MDV7205356.1 helix-turn-helix domain-containing protein [Mycolicibacterium
MGYREYAPPPQLVGLVECRWVRTGPAEPGRVLPDGCMDLIEMDDKIVVAGPDTTAFITAGSPDPLQALRFRPGALPRLLGVPACELRNIRVDLQELRRITRGSSLEQLAAELAAHLPRVETAPWTLPVLENVTRRLAAGESVAATAHAAGWSSRTMQRQCGAVYGYGPATLRRILRFRRAVGLIGTGASPSAVAARAGYSDQPHLHREVRALAGVGLRQLRQSSSAANRSTEIPSGSSTVA